MIKKSANIQKLLEKLKESIDKNLNETEVIEIKNAFINKHLLPIYQELKLAPTDQKKEIGKMSNQFKNDINDICEEKINTIRKENEKNEHVLQYHNLIKSADTTKGWLTPLTIVSNEIIDFFKKLDFKIVYGSEIVSIKHNFDWLNIPKNHPSRSRNDTFYLEEQNDFLLRTHNTAITIGALENNQENDIRVVSVGNVYRNDEDDATHSHQFIQFDIVWVREDLNVLNLKWLIDSLLKHIFGKHTNSRYRLSYFPFTEPSLEVDIQCINCGGKGCNICKKSGWIEILGCGMINKKVLDNVNCKCKNGFAIGIGVDRLVMIKYKFDDVRNIYRNNFNILKQFKE